MPSLLDVRKKIEATKNTEKITKAMQLVAASKMKYFQRLASGARVYASLLARTYQGAGAPQSASPYVQSRGEGFVLFVLLTSDKGLCGPMNAQVIRGLLDYDAWRQTDAADRRVITIGRKATDAVRRLNLNVLRSFDNIPEKMDTLATWQIIGEMVGPWEAGECRAVHVIAPDHISAFVFKVRGRQYLPFPEALPSEAREKADFLEPDQEKIVTTLSRRMLEARFAEAFAELKATEYSSRMVAMKKATDAAGEQIKLLTNSYNKARQAKITQELSELAAAAEAIV